MNTRTEEEETKKEGRFDAGATFHGTVTFHGPMFDIHDNQHVETHTHYARGGTAHLVTPSEERVKDALERLLEATDENGKRIFTLQYQWYAVWKVLQDYGYSKDCRAFVESMQTMLPDADPACKVESIRKIGIDVPGAANNLDHWKICRNTANENFKNLIKVAMTLMELLAQ